MLTGNQTTETENLEKVIREAITNLLLEDDQEDVAFTTDGQLVDIGLNSLMFAQLLVELEAQTGVDPFSDGEVSVTDMHSVRELTEAYENSLRLVVKDS